MTTFVKVHPGVYLNVATVRETKKGPTEDLLTLVLDRGGERWAKKEDWEEALRRAAGSVFAAAPGTFHLYYYRTDGDGIDIGREPIISWLACSEGVIPMTLQRTLDGPDDCPAIEFPDGTVQSIDGIYQSVHTWVSDMTSAERKVSRQPDTLQ